MSHFKNLPDDVIVSIFKKMKPSDIANVYWTYRADPAFIARMEKMYDVEDIDWYSVFQHIYDLEMVEEMLHDQEIDEFEDDCPLELFDEISFEKTDYFFEEYFDQEAFIQESIVLRDNYSV